MKQKMLSTVIVALLGTTVALKTQAATLNTGDQLTISPSVIDTNSSYVLAGSWYAFDNNLDGIITTNEKNPTSQGTEGIIIGSTQTPGKIDSFIFMGSPGSHYTTTGITGGTSGLAMNGWSWMFNGGFPGMNLGAGAWGSGFTNGVANFTWDGTYGHSYTLDYHATIPTGDPYGFSNYGNTIYALHLEGTVNAVPVPAAGWLLGSGLLGLASITRKRKTA